MYFGVKDVKPVEGYLLYLTFKNGESRVFDLKPYLETGGFKALKDYELFRTARISFDTVEWDDEIDIDPETLYHESKLI